jgi:putative ABC transport system ATP-binding protein
LINDPKIIIADEPTANLDSALSQDFMGHMEELRASGKTVLITSHDPLVFGASCVDRVIEMRDGVIQ